MLSRVAESIYWMSRYVERADNVSRFVHVNLNLQLEVPDYVAAHAPGSAGDQWKPLIWTTGDEKLFEKKYSECTRENVMQFLTFDADNPNSILSCVRYARENARSIREVISSEMWTTLNRFYLMVTAPDAPQLAASDPHTFYTDVRSASALFVGETMGTMSHNEGWHFSRIARVIERADKTSRILDVKYYILLPKVEYVGMPIDTLQWAALLKSASGLETYRQMHSGITPSEVTQFLLLDREFPRAVRYCVTKAEESLRAITGNATASFTNPAERKLGRLVADLDYSDIKEIIGKGLHEYVDSLQTRLNQVDEEIYKTFFEVRHEPSAETQTQTQSA